MASYDISYEYDGRGNRTKMVDHLAGATTTYAYDRANQLLTEDTGGAVTTYAYDPSGNRTRKETPGALTEYEWNEDNRLTKASPVAGDVTFGYNAAGQRVRKETPTGVKRFIYDYERLLQETDDAGDTQRLYTATEDEYGNLISEYDGAASSFHQYDALGSTDALLDADETATDRYRYRAFGLPDHYTGASDSPFAFVGRQGYYHDQEIDLYYLGAGNASRGGRPYDYQIGRFLSEDPVGFAGGDVNLYRYVGNNPVNESDPSGLAPYEGEFTEDSYEKWLEDAIERCDGPTFSGRREAMLEIAASLKSKDALFVFQRVVSSMFPDLSSSFAYSLPRFPTLPRHLAQLVEIVGETQGSR